MTRFFPSEADQPLVERMSLDKGFYFVHLKLSAACVITI